MRIGSAAVAAIVVSVLIGCGGEVGDTGEAVSAAPVEQAEPAEAPRDLTLGSSAFTEGSPIPLKYSAYDEEVTPPLDWSDPPEGTRSFALILDDPDDGPTPYIHWVMYNIPADARALPEGLPADEVLTEPAELAGTRYGLNNRRNAGYYGPEPRRGDPPHGYRFHLYALDLEPDLPEGLNADGLREAIEGSVLAETVLVGTFQAPPAD